jgi:hypothetical protein
MDSSLRELFACMHALQQEDDRLEKDSLVCRLPVAASPQSERQPCVHHDIVWLWLPCPIARRN